MSLGRTARIVRRGDTGEVHFPTLRGRSLAGSDLVLPGDLAGVSNVLILAFQQRQQRDVDGWIAALEEAGVAGSPPHDESGRAVPGELPAVVYEIPMLGGKWQAFRGFIDGGMASSIRVPAVLSRTVTVYGQIGAVERALDLPERNQVYAVVERAGHVRALAAGWPADVDPIVSAALG